MTSARVLSVNCGRARRVQAAGREWLSAIGKQPVHGVVEVRPLGLDGDEQADLSLHGGLAKAVYAYPAQHYRFWQTVRAQARVSLWDEPLPPGSVGENLTVEGVDEAHCWIGDVWRFPDCDLAVSEPRRPCGKFAAAMGFPQAVKLMEQSGFCGVYLAVHSPGRLQAGQAFEVIPGPRQVSIAELFRARV